MFFSLICDCPPTAEVGTCPIRSSSEHVGASASGRKLLQRSLCLLLQRSPCRFDRSPTRLRASSPATASIVGRRPDDPRRAAPLGWGGLQTLCRMVEEEEYLPIRRPGASRSGQAPSVTGSPAVAVDNT